MIEIEADVNVDVFSTGRGCWYVTWEKSPGGGAGAVEPTFTRSGALRKAKRQLQRTANRKARKLNAGNRSKRTRTGYVIHIDVTKLREAENGS